MLKLPFYVISDTHWGHKNIVHYAHRPYDHETMMIKRWRETVKKSDTVLHLGDLFFSSQGGYSKFLDISQELPGKKYLILGNHDKKKYDYEADFGFKVIKPFWVRYRGFTVTFDHYPKLLPFGQKNIHIHGHLHRNPYSGGEFHRYGNINASIELMDYRPVRATRLLDKEISLRTQRKRFYNSRHLRHQRVKRNRRAA